MSDVCLIYVVLPFRFNFPGLYLDYFSYFFIICIFGLKLGWISDFPTA